MSRSAFRFTRGSPAELNDFAERLLNGGLQQYGVRLVDLAAVPTAAPAAGAPNLVLVGGILYVWDGSAWTKVGLQT